MTSYLPFEFVFVIEPFARESPAKRVSYKEKDVFSGG